MSAYGEWKSGMIDDYEYWAECKQEYYEAEEAEKHERSIPE